VTAFGRAVPAECWVHPALEIRASSIEGRGLFATAPIAAATRVARLGGRLVTRTELLQLFAVAERDPERPYIDCISIGPGIDLVLPPNQPIHFCNHGCDPNVWQDDAFTLTARRAIRAGDELTIDYGTQSDGDFTMQCRCGSPLCRGEVTGLDWQKHDLQTRYGEHWVPVLRDRIRALRAVAHERAIIDEARQGEPTDGPAQVREPR
jgi:uncharacterized protein